MSLLIIWSTLSLVWWIAAWWLVKTPFPAKPRSAQTGNRLPVTLFKPLPKQALQQQITTEENLCSWIRQMQPDDEMLIGCYEADAPFWHHFSQRCQNQYPSAVVRVISHPSPHLSAPNPKIAWMKTLVEYAQNPLWLWSDVDVFAPATALATMRNELLDNECALLTCAYRVAETRSSAAILDTLFVNLEFYPGAKLMARTKAIEFGFGAGMLFRRDDFEQRVNLNALGQHLADDYQLGQQLQPVHLSSVCLSTTVDIDNWRPALQHYFRWQKTIRWNRPGGFAAQAIVMPLLGWLAAAIHQPGNLIVWLGLLCTLCVDSIAALTLCKLHRTRLARKAVVAIPLWSLLRPLTFLACWLPLPAVWRGEYWSRPLKDDHA